jgi:HEAT repeat protein
MSYKDSEEEIQKLISIFGEEDADVEEEVDDVHPTSKEIASINLFLIGGRAVAPLIQALKNENITIREWVSFTLGNLQDDRIIEPFVEIIQDQHEELFLRLSLIRILGTLKKSQIVEPLVAILESDNNINVKINIAEVLGNVGDERAVKPLIREICEIKDTRVKRAAINALAEIGDLRAVDIITKVLKEEEDFSTQSSAVYALGKLKDPSSYDLILPLVNNTGLRQAVIIALGNLGDKRACRLLTDLLEKESVYYSLILKALCKLGPECAYDLVLKIFKSGSNFKATVAASCLGEFHLPEAFDLLMSKIRNSDEYLEPYAVLALGELGDRRAFEPLVEVLTKAPERLAIFAAIALGRLGDRRAFEPLIKAYKSKNPKIRFRVVRALGHLREPRALSILKQIALNDFERDVEVEEESGFIYDAAIKSIKEIRSLTA